MEKISVDIDIGAIGAIIVEQISKKNNQSIEAVLLDEVYYTLKDVLQNEKCENISIVL